MFVIKQVCFTIPKKKQINFYSFKLNLGFKVGLVLFNININALVNVSKWTEVNVGNMFLSRVIDVRCVKLKCQYSGLKKLETKHSPEKPSHH